MDRPLGPRQPDKRNAAYESIFGRPSAGHHQLNSHPGHFPQYQQSPPPNGQQNAYYPQQYPNYVDRRTSGSSHAQSINYPQQPLAPPSTYRQSYLPPPQGYPPYQQSLSNYSQGNTLAAPSIISRARSLASSPGVIAPPPEEPPDASLEALTRAGLTPAQAYQAQVYANGPNGDLQQPPPPQTQVPVLGVNIETDDGRLGIDFVTEVATPSDLGTEGSHGEPAVSRHRSKGSSVRSRLSAASSHYVSPEASAFPIASSSRPYPLQLDTVVPPSQKTSSPASSTMVDASGTLNGRRSSESSRTLPGPAFRKDHIGQDRSRSMSATMTPQFRAMLESGRVPRPPIPPALSGRDSPAAKPQRSRTPIVYPALLSRVAEAFKSRIVLQDRVKDGLTYKDAFDGREAVDKIAYIIKTTDRNLALLLGRALDAQKFFHAVTYDHRLRDSANDLYQFRTKLPSPFVSGELVNVEDEAEGITKALGRPLINDGGEVPAPKESPSPTTESDAEKTFKDGSRPSSPSPPDSVTSPTSRPRRGSISSDDVPLPSGVFTLLTDCYSPTCSRDQLCYSIACPRRLEQQARLNMKPQPGLKKQISRESLGDLVVRAGILFLVAGVLTCLFRSLARSGSTLCPKRWLTAFRTPRRSARRPLTRSYTRSATSCGTWSICVT